MNQPQEQLPPEPVPPIPFPEVLILSEADALEKVRTNPGKYNVVSLWSETGRYESTLRESPKFHNKEKGLLQLRFHDIESARTGKTMCDDKHIQKILKFARLHQGVPLLIHCKQGVSRSSAATFCILLDFFSESPDPIDAALENLIKIKSPELIRPNKYIVSLGIFNIAKTGVQAIQWQRKFGDHPLYEKLYG